MLFRCTIFSSLNYKENCDKAQSMRYNLRANGMRKSQFSSDVSVRFVRKLWQQGQTQGNISVHPESLNYYPQIRCQKKCD